MLSTQVSRIVFSAHLTVLLILQLYEVKLQKSHKSVISVHKVSQIVFSAHLTVLRIITTVWEKTLKNLISPWVQCTSITNGVLSSYDRFTAYYNCMSYNFRNLISPRVQCTKTTNRVISSFDRFTDYYNRMSKNFKNLYLREFSAQVSQIVYSAQLTVLRLITTVWEKSSKISYLRRV